jgi:hypothetical protein
MAIVEQNWSALPVPFPIELAGGVPKERYYDPDFYRLESEQLWPRTWQMACRLEEIPRPGDHAGPETPPMPELWPHDDARWPPIPTQDFSNLPKQQVGLHTRTFEYMRLSERNEGHISNFQRVLDGYLAGYPTEKLLAALRQDNLNPLEQPVAEIEL